MADRKKFGIHALSAKLGDASAEKEKGAQRASAPLQRNGSRRRSTRRR